MTLLQGVSLTDRHTSKNCKGCKEVSESHRNVALEMLSLRVMVKRSRGKRQQEETKKQQQVTVTENSLFKGFTSKGVRKYDKK